MALSQEPNDSTHSFQLVVKRLFDIMIAVAILVIASPLLLLVTLAIKLETRSPALSRLDTRCYSDWTVHVLKFRCNAATQKLTRLGHLLSQSGVDRLPMLVNVLRGEMSIVGISFMSRNEPPLPDELSVLQRTKIKPGLLKWSQAFHAPSLVVRSRAREQIENDWYYVANWSLLLDAKIILKILLSKSSYELDGKDGGTRRASIGRT